MMTRNISKFILLLLMLPSMVLGQLDRTPSKVDGPPVAKVNRAITGFEGGQNAGIQDFHPSVPRRTSVLIPEVNIGSTLYDLQSNGSLNQRLIVNSNGTKAAAWMLDLSFDDEYPDRGTGLNTFENAWQEPPMVRIESERTGWPSLNRLSDGSLIITSHTLDDEIHLAKRSAGSTEWMESKVPTITPVGRLWPHSIVGGPNGMTIHLVALSTPTPQDGEVYLGLDGHLLYSRSQDGGETWDILDAVVPGLDSSQYRRMSADSYRVVSRGSTVAIVHFGDWSDVVLAKSIDNGTTWTNTVIYDFPLDKYVINSGYEISDIPQDSIAPDSLAIYTSTGEGAALIDKQGLVHVVYADNYVIDDSLTDGGTSFYPFTSGISYWNENLTDRPILIGDLMDYNLNDTIEFFAEDVARYANLTVTSMPSITTDDQGGIYVTYSAVSEAHYNELDEQHYRHLLVVKSLDGGTTWGPIYDIINDELSDPEFNDFIEAVYPSLAMAGPDTLHLMYQQDFFPGYRFVDSMDARAENFMTYLAIPTEMIPYDGPVPIVEYDQDLDVQVFPNPSNGRLRLISATTNISDLEIQVFNLAGQLLHSSQQTSLPATMALDFLKGGTYFLKLHGDQGIAWRKLIVH